MNGAAERVSGASATGPKRAENCGDEAFGTVGESRLKIFSRGPR
jgi:hypothetical protein